MPDILAVWPITDPARTWDHLTTEALADLPAVAARTGVRLTGPGHWRVARSVDVPGSGRSTEHVLLYRGPAEPTRHRPYRHLEAAS